MTGFVIRNGVKDLASATEDLRMLGLIARLFHRRDDESLFGAPPDMPVEPRLQTDISVQRWDAADTRRLNAPQFENVTGNTINEDLVSSLPVLMARCAYEASTNPTIEGMIDTHAIDIVASHRSATQRNPIH